MASSFEVPTLDEIHALLLADHQNRNPNDDVSQDSDTWKRLRILALAAHAIDAHVEIIYEDLLPDGAAGTQLERIGRIYGVERKQPTSAHKEQALRITGTAGSTYTSGDQLTHKDGTRFQVDSSGTIPAIGYVDVDVLALDTGSITRKNAREILTFVSTPSGLQANAELQLAIDVDGEDIEATGTYRQRILDKLSSPGMGGNANDYRTWALEIDGIDTAYVYSNRNGLGSVDIAALHGGSGPGRALTGGELSDLLAYVDALRPVSVADFRVLSTVAEPNDVDVVITPEDGAENAFDWVDNTPLVVLSWTAATRVLRFDTSRKPDMQKKDRICIRSLAPPYGDGSELVIEELSSTDSVVLASTPAVAPVAGDQVYSGGPLVSPIRALIIAHIDSLGPARGDYAAGIWEGSLRTSKIFKLVQTYPGVLDSRVVIPTTNVDPTNTAPDSSVGFITPQIILVRRDWNP